MRAFNPWPVAETHCDGQQLRVWEANVADANSTAAPGTVVATGAEGIQVATGSGILNLTRVQLAGRKAVSAAQFLNAHPLDGTVLAGSKIDGTGLK